MSSKNERMQILEMIENGQLSAEDGIRLLNALGPEQNEPDFQGTEAEKTGLPEGDTGDGSDWQVLVADELAGTRTEEVSMSGGGEVDSHSASFGVQSAKSAFESEQSSDESVLYGEVQSPDAPPATGLPPDARKWKGWWMVPLWIGVIITVSGGFLMYTAMENAGFSLGFVCAGVPFLIGMVLLVLAWQSRTAPWLHLRVQQRPGERPQRIAFSFPIPIRPTVWMLRIFGGRVRELEKVSLDEMLLVVGNSATPDNPIYIKVDEGDRGEKVEIFIG